MEDGRSRLSRPGALFHSSHLGPEFRVLCLLMSVPNRVWDSMGPPCLTYLASYISSAGPSWFSICTVVGEAGRGPQVLIIGSRGPVGQCSCWSKALRSAGCLPALQ